MMTIAQVNQYLERIEFGQSPHVDMKTLNELQFRHVMSIPFENLDIHDNNPIELDEDKLFDKIVRHRRGGFCYELNGLYCELLLALGFETRRVAARVYNKEGVRGPEFDHLALLVKVDDAEYLTDIGFGEFTFSPIKFVPNEEHPDERGVYFIENLEEREFRVIKVKDGLQIPQYSFRDKSHKLKDFASMCYYHQTNPKSHFTQKKFITRPIPNGRITLFEDRITFKENDEVIEEKSVEDKKHFDHLLKRYFDMVL